MADFGGFLEERKRSKNMARNTEMSQIDGLVSNLRTDIDQMMLTARKKKKQGQISKAQEAALIAELRNNADRKENELNMDDIESMMKDSVFTTANADDTVLQKRPSNSGPRQTQTRQSINIFADKARGSNLQN